jgi:branched-chain amino acid transport system substrate-binding protein
MAVSKTHVACRAVGRDRLMAHLFPLVIALPAAFAPAAAFADVTLGVLIPLTGPGSGYGQQMRTAIDIFSEKYLDLGSKAGKLRLDVQDTRGNVPEAINLTRKLIDSGNVVAIVGPQYSSEAEVVFPLGVTGKMPIITAMAAKPGIASANQPWAFRFSLTSEKGYGPLLDAWLKKNSPTPIKKVVVFFDAKDAVSSFDGNTLFPNLLKERGVEVLEKITFQNGDMDFSAQVTRAKGRSPDGIVFAGFYNEGAQLLKEARKQGMNQPAVANVGINHPRFIQAGGSAVEGVMSASDFSSENPAPAVVEWSAEFQKRRNEQPGNGAALLYDTLFATRDCIIKQGITGEDLATDREKMRDCWLTMKNLQTPLLGSTTMVNGDAIRLPAVLQVRDGRFTLVK